MIANIYINGQIGDTFDDEGNVTEVGVKLQDVVMQVESNKHAETIYAYIDSNGGSVQVGTAIADYLASMDNVVTVAKGQCASIATAIHLSRPLHQRKMVAGTDYFIHNPLLDGVRGNADELERAAAHVRPYEEEMQKMYVKATGVGKEAIKGLMSQETSLTDEQCLKLNFVSEVIPNTELKAVAFYDKSKTNKNQKEETMEKSIMDKINGLFKGLRADLKLEEKEDAKAMTATTDKGVLVWASENMLPAEGEVVTFEDGSEVPAEDYTMEDGTVITVGEGGVVTLITAPAEAETVESLQAKIEEMEASHEAEKTEILQKFKTDMNELKASISSTYVPKAEKKVFNKNAKPVEVSFKEKRKERLEAKKN